MSLKRPQLLKHYKKQVGHGGLHNMASTRHVVQNCSNSWAGTSTSVRPAGSASSLVGSG
jgi:hypothetical protein